MIDQKTLEHYAKLAKIEMVPERDIPRICVALERVSEISRITLAADDEPYDAESVNALRDDVGIPPMPRERLLANAPETEAGCVSVPKIL